MATNFDPNAIDLSALPHTLAIIGVVAIIWITLKCLNKKYNWVARIEAATPWMEWNHEETDVENYEYENATTRYPRNDRFESYL